MSTRVSLIGLLMLISFNTLALVPDSSLRIDSLWSTFEQIQTPQQATTAIDEEVLISLIGEAAELIAAHEAGLIELSVAEFERLQFLFNQMPLALPPRAAPRGAGGTIAGTLSEAGSGLAISDGLVVARRFGDFTESFSAAVQVDGSYSIAVPPGVFIVQTQNQALHLRQAWPDLDCTNPKYCSPWYGGETITIADGDLVDNIDFQLERGVAVTGAVTDPIGTPIEGAFVRIIARNRQTSGFAVTDAAGQFTFSAVPAGPYRLYAEANSAPGLLSKLHDGQDCAGDCATLPVSFATLSDTVSAENFDFQLADGFGLSGQVFEADGVTPLAQAQVQLISGDGLTSRFVSTDALGQYAFSVLRATDYRILVSHNARLGQVHDGMDGIDCFGLACDPEIGTPVNLGSTSQTLDFSLNPGVTVSGRILRASDNSPLENASVSVANSLIGGRFAMTDSNGDFEIGGLIGGDFYVRGAPSFDNPELQPAYLGDVTCPLNFCPDFGQPLNVPEGSGVTGVEIRLPLGGGLTGTMFDAVTGLAIGQTFVSRLELWVASGPFKGELARQAVAGPDHNYQIDGVSPGAYKATFGTSTHLGLIDTAFGGQPCPRGACDLDALPTVFVTAGATLTGISATLTRGPVISGRVLDAVTGEPPAPPLPTSAQSQFVGFYGTSGNYASFDSVDGDGFYRSRTGFPNDTFFVSTYMTRNDFGFGGGYIDAAFDDVDCPRLKCNLTATATALNVAGSNIENIDFNLRQGGVISGTITNANDASPLGNIVVEAYNAAGDLVAQANSNALGNYRIDALPAGNVYVRTRNGIGFQDQLHNGISCTPFCNPVSGAAIAITEGNTSSGIDFGLVRSVAISGSITLAGSPIGGVMVEAYGAIGNLVAQTLSGSDGSFAFTNLAPGEFYLRTRNSFGHADVLYDGRPCVGNACLVRRGDALVLSPGAEISGLNLNLTAGAVISGEVHDRLSPATKLSGVRVQLLDERGAVAFERTTNAAGQFSFGALAAGEYHLVTRQTPGYVDQALGGAPCPSACNGLNGNIVSVAAGGSATGNNLDLAPGASISGNVSASGTPAVGAQVQIYNEAGVPVAQGPTNPSGNFEINELPDGDFYVRARNVPGFISELWDDIACSGFCDILNGDPVTITGSGSVGSVNFVLAAGGSIGGTVTSGASALPGVEIVAYDNAGFVAGSGVTNASGQYLINGLVNGNYRLRSTNLGGFVDQVFGGASCSPSPCPLSGGTAVSVAGGAIGGINFNLSAGSSISGTATDSFGNPLPGGTAVLYDANGIELLETPINNGLWSFSGLANGTYYLLIENNLGLVDELFNGIPCPAGACDITGLGTPIVLGDSGLMINSRGTSSIDVVLEQGQIIRGRVSDAGSQAPLVGVSVFFFNSDGSLAGQAVTDGLGEYESLGGLPPGSYYAATASGRQRGVGNNYINTLYDGANCLLACDFSQGSLISLGGSGADGIDFALTTGAGLRGRVAGPGDQNLVQVDVLLFDSNGILAGQVRTNSQGRYSLDGLPAGDYYAHTLNNLGLEDVVFGDVACNGNCEPLSGQVISVPASGFAEDIDFQLNLADQVFADRFE